MTTTRRGTLGIFVGFAPWIAFWTLSGAGARMAGLMVALATAAGLCAWHLRRGRLKPMEAVAVTFFTLQALIASVLGASALAPYDAVLTNAALATMALGTLGAGTPFTAQYSREDWPPVYWKAPLFRRINAGLTALWGGVFAINAGLGALSLAHSGATLWLEAVLPNLVIAAGVAISIAFPRWYPSRWATRQVAARDPYPWRSPLLTPGRSTSAYDVIVVGAGIGGLTAAALLAQRELKTLVLEQHYLPGGFCTSWPRIVRAGERRLRYVFDAGVHDVSGLGPRGPVRHLLEGLDLTHRIEWRRVAHEYILPGLRLKVPHRAADFAAALGARFPAERHNVEAFFAEMEAVYRELYADVHLTGGVPCPPPTAEAMVAYPSAHPHAFRWMNVPFGVMLDTHFRDPRLKEVLSVLTGYLSDNPKALTVAGMAPIFGFYFDGGFYPVGGSQVLADVLVEAIRDHGGEVRLRTAVSGIRVRGGRAVGVALADGRTERAEAVVSNADVRRTFLELVGPACLPRDFVRRVTSLGPSTSAFAVFLGVDYVPDIEPLTIQVADGRGLAIAVPSKVDASLAPPGHGSITLITLVSQEEAVGWDRKAPGYAARKRSAGDNLIVLAEGALPGLRDHVIYRQEGTPATFARYAWTTAGSIYGLAAGQYRPPAKSPLEGLVLAGAGVFPGAGVEAAVISGTLAADALCSVERTHDEALPHVLAV